MLSAHLEIVILEEHGSTLPYFAAMVFKDPVTTIKTDIPMANALESSSIMAILG